MGNRRMRYTSSRRRAGGSGGVRYDGRGISYLKEEVPLRKVPDDTPNSVVCTDCGVRTKALKSNPDRPVSHAPGGYTISPAKGRYRCPNSGSENVYERFVNYPEANVSTDSLPILTEHNARVLGLINDRIIAGRYDIARTTVMSLHRKGKFVPCVAYLAKDNVMHPLFASALVDAFMAAHHIKKKVKKNG